MILHNEIFVNYLTFSRKYSKGLYKAIKNAREDIVCATINGIPEISVGINNENLKITFKMGVSTQNAIEKIKDKTTKGNNSFVFLERT